MTSKFGTEHFDFALGSANYVVPPGPNMVSLVESPLILELLR